MKLLLFARTAVIAALVVLASAMPISYAPLAQSASSDYGLSETGKKIGYVSATGKSDDVYSVVAKMVSAFLGALGIIFFGLMIYAGIRWMTARGNEELVGKAKHTLEAAMIGAIVVVLSYALTVFVLGRWPVR